MATRCRSPPESSAGRWSSRSASPTRRSNSVARCWSLSVADAVGEERHEHVFKHRALRQQVMLLKHEANLPAAKRGELLLVRVRTDSRCQAARCRRSAVRVCRGSTAACFCRSRWGRGWRGFRRAAARTTRHSSTRSGVVGVGYSLTMLSTTRSAAGDDVGHANRRGYFGQLAEFCRHRFRDRDRNGRLFCGVRQQTLVISPVAMSRPCCEN